MLTEIFNEHSSAKRSEPQDSGSGDGEATGNEGHGHIAQIVSWATGFLLFILLMSSYFVRHLTVILLLVNTAHFIAVTSSINKVEEGGGDGRHAEDTDIFAFDGKAKFRELVAIVNFELLTALLYAYSVASKSYSVLNSAIIVSRLLALLGYLWYAKGGELVVEYKVLISTVVVSREILLLVNSLLTDR